MCSFVEYSDWIKIHLADDPYWEGALCAVEESVTAAVLGKSLKRKLSSGLSTNKRVKLGHGEFIGSDNMGIRTVKVEKISTSLEDLSIVGAKKRKNMAAKMDVGIGTKRIKVSSTFEKKSKTEDNKKDVSVVRGTMRKIKKPWEDDSRGGVVTMTK